MYNENVKNEFLKTKESMVKNQYISIFNGLESLENIEGTDLCNLPADLIIAELKDSNSIKIKTANYLRSVMSRINNYKKWALKNNLMDEDAKHLINMEVKYRSVFLEFKKWTLLKTPKMLVDYTQKAFPSKSEFEDANSCDDLITAYLMLVYQGFKPDEILNITLSNVHVSKYNISIITKDRTVIIYDEFTEAIRKLIMSRKYVVLSHNNFYEMKERLLDDGLGSPNAEMKKKMSSRISQNRQITSNTFKLNELWLMGGIYAAEKNNFDAEKPLARRKVLADIYGTVKVGRNTKDNLYRLYDAWIKCE